MIELLNNGSSLIQQYSSMYGTHYSIETPDGPTIYNLDLRSISSLIKMCKKSEDIGFLSTRWSFN